MSKKIKLGKPIIEQLQNIAKMLPHIPTSSGAGSISQTITGATAKAAGIKAAAGSGIKEIEDNNNYLVPIADTVGINHFKNLKRIYSEEGNEGVEKYAAKMKQKKLDLLDEQVKKNPPTPEEIQAKKQKTLDEAEKESAGKKRRPKLSGNKNTSKKSK